MFAYLSAIKPQKKVQTVINAFHEGMADFYLLADKRKYSKPEFNGMDREKLIWAKFSEDMYFNRYSNWIANGKTSSKDNPPDQGYWVG